MEEGDFEVLCEFIGDAMQRVRGADEEIGSGALGRLGFGREIGSGLRPQLICNEVLDVSEIDANDDGFSDVPSAEALIYSMVDEAIVLGGSLVAHAAENADGAE